MLSNSFIHLFTGSSIDVILIVATLEKININPVVKDESESARLAGFGIPAPLLQRVFVHSDEYKKAVKIIGTLFLVRAPFFFIFCIIIIIENYSCYYH